MVSVLILDNVEIVTAHNIQPNNAQLKIDVINVNKQVITQITVLTMDMNSDKRQKKMMNGRIQMIDIKLIE